MPGHFYSGIVPLVGAESALAGTGIVVSPTVVITCRHVLAASEGVRCGTTLCRPTRTSVARQADLGCLYFDNLPEVKPLPLFRASRLTDFPLMAAGFEPSDGGGQQHRIPELKVIHEDQLDGLLQEVQFEGGAAAGLSGAPVMVQSAGEWRVVGMLWLGRKEAATSRMIASDAIAAFLEKEGVDVTVNDLPEPAGCLRIPSRKWIREEHAPAAMLVAECEIVPFGGRERELADIAAWASGPQRIGVRLYHERGGVGKTRLALEACKRLAKQKIRSGFLDLGATDGQIRQLFAAMEGVDQPRLFVVIDYAESNPASLRNLIAASEDFPAVHLRIVLLARGLGDWWQDAKYSGGGVGAILTGPATEQPLHLGPVGVSAEFRASEFRRAATAFAGALGQAVPDYGDIDLSAPIFERALLLHTCALLTVMGVPFEVRTTSSHPFLEALWGRETRFLKGVMESRHIDPMLGEAALQATAAITAIGGSAAAENASSAIRALPLLRGTGEYAIDALARLLHDVYGGSQWIDPLQPDILGEYVVAKVFRKNFAALNAVLTR